MKGVYVDLNDLIRIQHKARGFTFLPRQPVHSLLSGRHASRMRGRGLNFEEIRRYFAGDDIRTIDWKVTARTRKPHTRVFTEERDRPAMLLVDQRINMFFGTKVNLKSVTAAEAAALSAWRVVELGDRVGAIVFNDTDTVEIRPHRSRNTVMRILQAVTEMNQVLSADSEAKSNPGMLNVVLENAFRNASHDYLFAVISDFDGADETTQRHLLKMSQHNDVICALVHDSSATDLPPSRNFVITDGELQIELEIGKERMRKKVVELASGRIAKVLGWQKNIGVPVLPINTGEGVAEQVRSLLGHMTPVARR